MSGDEEGEKAWCKLEFEDADTDTVSVTAKTFSVGRLKENDLRLQDPRVSSRHCQIIWNEKAGVEGSLVLMDGSTNGTFVDGKKVGKGQSKALSDGDKVEIVVGEPKFTFIFRDTRSKEEPDDEEEEDDHGKTLEVCAAEEEEGDTQPEAKPAAAKDGESKGDDDIESEIKCAICLGICHKIVTLIPCMHNFCSSCYSQTLDTPMGKKCPQCRAATTEVRRNHTLHNIIEKFLKDNPSRKRSAEDLAEMDAKDKITDESLRVQGRKRRRDDHGDDDEDDSEMDSEDYSGSEDEDEEDEPREQCHNCSHAAPDGFQCGADAPHVRCDCCMRLFPRRTATADGSLVPASQQLELCHGVVCGWLCAGPLTWKSRVQMPPSTCPGCDKRCCGPYFHWLNQASPAPPPPPAFGRRAMCWEGGSGALGEAALGPALPPAVFRANPYERALCETAMANASFTPSQLFQHCVREAKAGNLSIHPSLPRADHLSALVGAPPSLGREWACPKCIHELFAALAFSWRLANPDPALPTRPDCHWGFNCRTQTHNPGHRERYNHVCPQTRF